MPGMEQYNLWNIQTCIGTPKISVVSVVISNSVLIDQSYFIMIASTHYENTCPNQRD